MGSMISSIFGGGYSAPEVPEYTPAPQREEINEDQSTRDAERKKLRARAGGVRSTLLGSQLGKSGENANSMGLLGRSF